MVIKGLSRIFFLVGLLVLSSSWPIQGRANNGIIGDDYELVHLMRCLTHIIPISQVDSHNPQLIRATSALSIGMTSIALVHALGRKVSNTRPFIQMAIVTPRVVGCFLALTYDMIRYYDAQNLALKNLSVSEKAKYKSFKFQQYLKLLFEAGLRIIALLDSLGNGSGLTSVSHMADLLEIWRLVGRYETYFGIAGYELQVNFLLRGAKGDELAEAVNPKEGFAKLQEALLADAKAEDIGQDQTQVVTDLMKAEFELPV